MFTYLFSTSNYYISVFDSWLFVLQGKVFLKIPKMNCNQKINVNCRITLSVKEFFFLTVQSEDDFRL